MSRKQFIESYGATCNNWNWSWSFINRKKKLIIFGAWDYLTNHNESVIFKEEWKFNKKGRKNPGYQQSLDHIHLINEEGYKLKTFIMIPSNKEEADNKSETIKIKNIIPNLNTKILMKRDKEWYAVDDIKNYVAEEIQNPELYLEGVSKKIFINIYERNTKARLKCISHYGLKCSVCKFDFEKYYGEIGKNYIHVHHIKPLASIGKKYKLDPIKDLRPICPNCHAMIHRTNETLTISQLKSYLKINNSN